MKLFGLGVLAAALLTPSAFAQATGGKVAIINIQQAILATQEGEKARTDIQQKVGPRAKDLEARQGEVLKKRETMQKGANTMSVEQREKLSREIDDLTKKLQWDTEDFNGEVEQEQQKIVNTIGQKLIQIVDEVAKEKGFSLVLDVSSQQSPVVWAADGIEISREVVDRYNKKYPIVGGAPPAAAPGATPAAPAVKPPAAKPAVPPKK